MTVSMRGFNVIVERLRKFYQEDSKTGCWNWIGSKNTDGYGNFRVGSKIVGAHRLSYELLVGPIPKDICVLHICDNPSCVNPDHLWLGTHADNSADKVAKNRQEKGEDRKDAKLTEDQILLIRRDNRIHSKIAEEYGIDQSTVSRIRSREDWRHVK